MTAPGDTEALLEERGKQYGDANVQYARVAEVWSGITGHTITAYQAMLCMVGLKLVRAEMNPNHDDSLADAKGYVVLAERLIESWSVQPDPQPEGYCLNCGHSYRVHLRDICPMFTGGDVWRGP